MRETQQASVRLREQSLRKTIAKDSAWPPGVWGDNLWTLAALHLNQKVGEANARLLRQATEFVERTGKEGATPSPTPENPGNAPWTFFSLTDYVRTLCLFRARSPHFPGRLAAPTEAAMKEALWLWVRGESRIADAGPEDLLLLLGTENHDLNRRPNHYLITAVLSEDPSYAGRTLADGHTVAQHAAAYTAFFREWPRRRAQCGLWVEVGSNTYQKYSWPALFNLHELAPDPVVRHRFGLLLDLACIEEEQVSVRGRRGGGRSRAEHGANPFAAYLNLLYATEGQPAGSSHSRVIETSRYHPPVEALLLRDGTFSPTGPVLLRNRVLGELAAASGGEEQGQQLAADSSLVNTAYRTRHYLLGGTLQNPALALGDARAGAAQLKYAGISRQKRACGLLLWGATGTEIAEVHPEVEHVGGGRPQHSFWSVQHENVLLLQRIAPLARSTMGSYNTGWVGMRFRGAALRREETAGWIFADHGQAFVGVKFLDGGHTWDGPGEVAKPASFDKARDTTRILLQAGDVERHGSFEAFKADVLASELKVTADQVEYRCGKAGPLLAVTLYDPKEPERFGLPRLNGQAIDLRPGKTYQGPYLNADFGGDLVTVTVGQLHRVLDFSSTGSTP